ncbi:MAG: glutathione S-transferase family protein, partial [Pseudomonadota bacterium]
FCSKVEIFLKLNQIPYESKAIQNPTQFPKKKLPVIIDDGQTICDSHFIIEHLIKKKSLNIDEHLNEKDKSLGFAYTKMVEEFLYWAIVHERWFIDENFKKLKASYFNKVPNVMRNFIAGMIRRSISKSAFGHGMGRHKTEEVMSLGKNAIHHLSVFLEEKPYLLGDKVSSWDASIYGFVASLLHSPLSVELKKHTQEYLNLIEYDKRLFNEISR